MRNSLLVRSLWGLMGVYLLNISVDAPDPYPAHIPEDLSLNDQESLVEFVLEVMLGFDNAMREYDDQDGEEHNKTQNLKIDHFTHFAAAVPPGQPDARFARQLFPDPGARLALGIISTDTPPPWT